VKIIVLRLGTVCLDRATELEGTVTHWIIGMGRSVKYLFQPKGLDGDGQPCRKLILVVERLEVSEDDYGEVDVPFEVLGTQVTSKSSGFTGMATEFIRHINGCFHVMIQPAGLSNAREAINELDIDMRDCMGEKIVELSLEDLDESLKNKPSPTNDSFQEKLPSNI
jgi:hypothetical protein